jgi:hypothetical protein
MPKAPANGLAVRLPLALTAFLSPTPYSNISPTGVPFLGWQSAQLQFQRLKSQQRHSCAADPEKTTLTVLLVTSLAAQRVSRESVRASARVIMAKWFGVIIPLLLSLSSD